MRNKRYKIKQGEAFSIAFFHVGLPVIDGEKYEITEKDIILSETPANSTSSTQNSHPARAPTRAMGINQMNSSAPYPMSVYLGRDRPPPI